MQISQKDKITIIILLVVVMVGGFYWYGIKPLMEKKTVVEAEITALETKKDEAEAQYYGVTSINRNKKQDQVEALQAEYDELVASGVTDADSVIWNGAEEKYATNYQLFDYMLNDYMVNELGMVVSEGSVTISTYVSEGVTKSATLNVSAFTCPSMSALESLLNKVASEKSLKITSISWQPDENDATAISGSMTLKITIAG